LGLAIVKSIVHSKGIEGVLNVESVEGEGTEMTITFDAEPARKEGEEDLEPLIGLDTSHQSLHVNMLSFHRDHTGNILKREIMASFLENWWGFKVTKDGPEDEGDIILVNEDTTIITRLVAKGDFSRPLIILSSARGDHKFMAALEAYEKGGGFIR
jgi:hypothetical protein